MAQIVWQFHLHGMYSEWSFLPTRPQHWSICCRWTLPIVHLRGVFWFWYTTITSFIPLCSRIILLQMCLRNDIPGLDFSFLLEVVGSSCSFLFAEILRRFTLTVLSRVAKNTFFIVINSFPPWCYFPQDFRIQVSVYIYIYIYICVCVCVCVCVCEKKN